MRIPSLDQLGGFLGEASSARMASDEPAGGGGDLFGHLANGLR